MFEGWENFYLMLGPAAAGLIGLLFVVVTLTGGLRARPRRCAARRIYMTPDGGAFRRGAGDQRRRPWRRACGRRRWRRWSASARWSGSATRCASASASTACEAARTRRTGPTSGATASRRRLIYLVLLVVAVALAVPRVWAPPAMAGLLLGLLLLGIRNAWDLVTWMAPRATAPRAGRRAR